MRLGVIAIGLILGFLGVILYFTGAQMIAEVEAYDVGGLPVSEFLKAVDPVTRQKYEIGQTFVGFGIILGVIGFVLFIVGFVIPDKESPYLQKVSATSQRNCPNCGRSIGMEYQLCPYCGRDFRIQQPSSHHTTQNKNKDKYCSECGTKLHSNAEFCSECGKKI